METANRTYFLANVCHVCKSKSASHPCEICRMIFYCSSDHRRSDWFDHSQICWAVNKISETGRGECLWDLCDGKDLTKFKHQVAEKCTKILQRCLKPWELEMIYHPRVCSVCGEYDWRKLSFCESCEFVYSCGKRHYRKDHMKWCKTLKLYSELIIYMSCGGEVGVELPEYVIKNKSIDSMVEILSENFEFNDRYKSIEIQKALTSELLTYPLTVFNVLKKIGAFKSQKLQILFIGAENQAEIEPLNKWENYLLHALENVTVLNLKFLGPELRRNNGKWKGNLCEICRKRGKTLEIEFINGMFFHEYQTDETAQPNLICAFNSGMYRDFGFGRENSWEKTIEKLFTRGTPPVLITEYTCRELNLVLERIGKSCGDVGTIVRSEMNAFASLKPGLNIISQEEAPVIFKNYFYTVLRKK